MILQQACKDFHACKWPEDLGNDDEDLALYFDKLNDKNRGAIEEVKKNSKQILTFSHFVPRLVTRGFYLGSSHSLRFLMSAV
jgi:hypothetical protein